MIDFHSHILPDIDDGSRDIEMSRNMLGISIAEGVGCISATPHFIIGEYEVERETYDEKIEALQKEYINKGIKIVPGLEVYINPDIPELYRKEKIWGINGKRYILIELPMREFPIYTEKIFYQLRLDGAIPILAHPERNFSIVKNIDLLINLVEQGNLAQLNAGSLRGIYGTEIKKFAEKLVEMNLIHLLGSDAHDADRRPTKISDGYVRVKILNPALYKWITENESNIIEGHDVDVLEIRFPKKKKSSLFGFLKK